MSAMWLVKEAVGIVIGDEISIAAFDSFWDASDYVGEHPEQSLYIEQWDGFVPVLTDEDLDAYAARSDKPDGKDPREGFDEGELPQVLLFLALTAQFKAMKDNQNMIGYEKMCYAYSDVADNLSGNQL